MNLPGSFPIQRATSNTRSRLAVVSLVFLGLGLSAPTFAQKPGDVFKEFTWRANPWQRIIGPDATDRGAKALLPNKTNYVRIDDLKDAVRAEIRIEKLTSHVGTVGPKIRLNDKSWIDIPFPDRATAIPGQRGDGGIAALYFQFYTPTVTVPLSDLRQGTNSIKLTCTAKGSHGFAKQWPQFITYGVTVRVYYKSSKPHATGQIVSPRGGSVLGDNPTFRVATKGSIAKVEYLGNYDDYNWRGDESTGWQRTVLYGEIGNNIGTSKGAPFSARWDTKWIPTQRDAFQVVARITDTSGMIYMTPAVSGLTLSRSKTVIRYPSQKLPMNWVTNYWQRERGCETTINDDLSKAEEATIMMSTWNGYDASEVGANGRKIVSRVGKHHELSRDRIRVSLSTLRKGLNTLYTKGSKQSHGIEVQWPGMEVAIRYDYPESVAQFATYGHNCRYSRYSPTLSASGRPILGRSYTLRLAGGYASSPVFLSWGTSNERDGQHGPLPLSLASRGAPGCFVWSSIQRTTLLTTDSTGRASTQIAVPNAPDLIGEYFFNQFLLPAAGANSLQVLTTNGSRTLMGR